MEYLTKRESYFTRIGVAQIVAMVIITSMATHVSSVPKKASTGPVMVTVGGYNDSGANVHTELYKVAGGNIVWSHRGEDLPVRMLHPGMAQSQTDIWMVYQNTAIRYNPASDTWHRLPHIHTDRPDIDKPPVFILNNTLYVASGQFNVVTMDALSLDDPEEGWRTVSAHLPHDISWTDAVVIRDTAYIAGGWRYDEGSYVNSLYAWKQGWQTWTSLAPMIHEKSEHCVVTDHVDKIFALGGFDGERLLSNMEEFSVITGSWASKADLPEPLSGLSCFYHQGKIFAVGGSGNNGKSSKVYVYDETQDLWDSSNSLLLQTPLAYHGALLIP